MVQRPSRKAKSSGAGAVGTTINEGQEEREGRYSPRHHHHARRARRKGRQQRRQQNTLTPTTTSIPRGSRTTNVNNAACRWQQVRRQCAAGQIRCGAVVVEGHGRIHRKCPAQGSRKEKMYHDHHRTERARSMRPAQVGSAGSRVGTGQRRTRAVQRQYSACPPGCRHHQQQE